MKYLKFVVVAIFAVVALPVVAIAEEAAKAVAVEEVFVEGKVGVVKNAEGAVTGVTLTTVALDDAGKEVKTVHKVTLDENGKKLAAEMDGKLVEVICVVAVKEVEGKTENWVTVKRFTVIEAPAAK